MEPTSAPWRVLESSEADVPAPEAHARGIPWAAVTAVLVATAIALGGFLLSTRSDPVIGVEGATSVESGSPRPGEVAADAPLGSRAELVVDVGGAVARPGVYRLPAGSRIGDAIAAAGGYGPRVDAAAVDARLNLAAILRDGDEVNVPSRGDPDSSGAGSGSGASTGGPAASTGAGRPLDLNTATAAELDTLPGVGPATAAKIIAAREEQPFSSVDDLRTRKVLGTAALEKIRPLVTAVP